jgi:hypothetical protein
VSIEANRSLETTDAPVVFVVGQNDNDNESHCEDIAEDYGVIIVACGWLDDGSRVYSQNHRQSDKT